MSQRIPPQANSGLIPISSLCAIGFLLCIGAAKAGTFTEESPTGANPGNLGMLLYLPEPLPSSPALVVVLHGCAQGAREYAAASGWAQIAERWGFLLLLPEQKRRNNLTRCFNWFRAEDNRRGLGEAHSIYEMIRQVRQGQRVDDKRVFITGVSAGGAMANAVLANYPGVFRGGGLFAAVPYGCATGVLSAFNCMLGRVDRTRAHWAERILDVAPGVSAWPDVFIWHGDADRIVDPHNASELEEQWVGVHRLEGVAEEERHPQYVRRAFHDAQGRLRVETNLVRGMGHGTPVDPGELPRQCGDARRFFPDVEICSSYRLARAWGLVDGRRAARLGEVQ